jgi:menaquinone-specific isochorismate synthase
VGKILNNFTMPPSLPVILDSACLFHDDQQLYQFLDACQDQAKQTGEAKILSFAQEISPLDPLDFFQNFTDSEKLHFYWENRNQKKAIIAIDAIKILTIDTPQRFHQAKRFIQDCQKQIIRIGQDHLTETGPMFFSNFTFFETSYQLDPPFPAATVFLPKIQLIRRNHHHLGIINLLINSETNLETIFSDLKQEIKRLNQIPKKAIAQPSKHPEKLILQETLKTSQFKQAVISALESINQNHFSKIVLAHAFDVTVSACFSLVDSLRNLANSHPDCYVFSVSNGQGSCFIGASPERLISIYNQELATDALAGSAPRGKNPLQDAELAERLLNSEKERREHQAVSNFIVKSLQNLGLNPQKSPLQLLQLSNIQHLWTPIHAQVPTQIHPLDIVAQLHPTPAVAGVPTKIACEQIRLYEMFDRSLYAAPIGWIDLQGNSEFIVGIRSALITGNHARLYGGAGIVAGSDPEKELAEVQLKLQSLLKALA